MKNNSAFDLNQFYSLTPWSGVRTVSRLGIRRIDLPSNAGISFAILKFNVAFVKGTLQTEIYLFQVTSVIIDSSIPLWFEGEFKASSPGLVSLFSCMFYHLSELLPKIFSAPWNRPPSLLPLGILSYWYYHLEYLSHLLLTNSSLRFW